MKLMMKNWSLWLVCLVYIILVMLTLNNCFFWDSIQQSSKEGYWFYSNNFSSLALPGFSDGSEIGGTGYHPPLMGLMTALMWSIFGMKLWVTHLFILMWAFLLAYHTHGLLKHFLPVTLQGWVMMIPLFDSTVLAQIAIASPDIVLLTSFVMALRAMIEKRKLFLIVSLIFLSLINGRGMFAAALIYVFSVVDASVHDREKFSMSLLFKKVVPFIPVGILLMTYFIYYFYNHGWFFNDPNSPWAEGWQSPQGLREYLKNLAAYGLRILENGRFFIWLVGLWVVLKIRNSRNQLFIRGRDISLVMLVVLFIILYLYFAMTTKIVICSRYYMPMFFVLVLITFILLSRLVSPRKASIVAIVSIVMLITGNFWIYPDKIAKAWDSTLAHLSYYPLREECFKYIEENNISPDELSGGFCFAGNQRYIDLKDRDYRISGGHLTRYFIYSNISNVEDQFAEALFDSSQWREVKTFRSGFVRIVLFEKINLN